MPLSVLDDLHLGGCHIRTRDLCHCRLALYHLSHPTPILKLFVLSIRIGKSHLNHGKSPCQEKNYSKNYLQVNGIWRNFNCINHPWPLNWPFFFNGIEIQYSKFQLSQSFILIFCCSTLWKRKICSFNCILL